MFYDQSEPDFPNWWDVIENPDAESGSGQEEHNPPDPSRPADPVGTHPGSVGSPQSPGSRYEGLPEDGIGGIGGSVEESETYEYRVQVVYDRDLVHRVWEFAEAVPGNDADLWRKDELGNWIYRLDYGRRESEFGWEIFDPGVGRHSQGVYAMRPLQWESYVRKYESMG